MSQLRGSACIVGAAESDLGDVGVDRYGIDLAAQAALRALDDAGLTVRDVDGLYSIVSHRFLANLDLAEMLGIRPRVSGSANIAGSSAVANLIHASAALAAGLAGTVLIVYGNTPRADGRRKMPHLPPDQPSYQAPYLPRDPVTGYALAAARHMHQFGTTREQLAEVAVAARAWAQLNPVAFTYGKGPLTIADVLESPMVSTPLSVRDCCLVTDGAGAIVVTRTDRARDLPKPPVAFLGGGEAHWHRSISQMPDLTVTAATQSGAAAFAMAGLAPADVDVLQLYDAFTINPILFLEDLGFCRKGEGGAFVSGGRIAPGGALPVNTSGGGLSYCHPGMYGIFTLIESVRQLRGEAGARQVAGAQVALAHGNGGQLSSQVTAILGTLDTI
ncbi:acetyl-CoA acetyltransferase [Sphingobium sp. Cam5-1]|uniref:acetyl-CoA acetyltransferase n=1 Tax=Sphingobium sp. Cam5-1 TaxID=2789327 RepID=UPI0018AD28B7|nr:acetyl-CoA acetyltransferase [Sphingobium sp. Cam5-1]QPI75043.1 thiolase [Sphingobium sp. Cam5-1]